MFRTRAAWINSRPGARWRSAALLNTTVFGFPFGNTTKIKYILTPAISSRGVYFLFGQDGNDAVITVTENFFTWTQVARITNFTINDLARKSNGDVVAVGIGIPGDFYQNYNLVRFAGSIYGAQTRYDEFPYNYGIVDYWYARNTYIHMREGRVDYGSTVPATNLTRPVVTAISAAIRDGAYPVYMGVWERINEIAFNTESALVFSTNGTTYTDVEFIDYSNTQAKTAGIVYSAAQNLFYRVYKQDNELKTIVYSVPTTSINLEVTNIFTLPANFDGIPKSLTLADAAGTLVMLLNTGAIWTSTNYGVIWNFVTYIPSAVDTISAGAAGIGGATTQTSLFISP
jgi:hypothetical protein